MTKTRIGGCGNQNEAYYVSRLLCALELEGYKTRCEVPNFSQSVDVVATKGRWVTAIEVKIFDWKGALKQCNAHENFADFVCIAIASKSVAPGLLEAVDSRGFGLLHYDHASNRFVWYRRPRQNRNYWFYHRKEWAKTLKDIEYAN